MPMLAIKGGAPVRTKLFPGYNTIGQEEKDAVNRVLDSGVLSRYVGAAGPDFNGGTEVQALEKEWAAHFGVKYAIAVNSCTTGLQAAVGACGIEPGDEVIVSPYTMSASAVAPLWYGAVPVFADIEDEYFCLDPKSVASKITERTKAIIVVDLFGQSYDRDAINAIAKKHNVLVIEDCAQAPGAAYKDQYAGTLGDVGVFSLNYHKHIHAGEGGIVVTNNDAIAERVRLIRNHAESVVAGKGITDIANMVGSNFRLTEIQAAIARVQLLSLQKLTEERIRNAGYLAETLGALPGIRAASVRTGATHVYYTQAFLYDEDKVGVPRDAFIAAVKAELPACELREHEGALISTGYVKPLYMLPLFQKKIAIGKAGYPFSGSENYQKGLCPIAERMHEKELIIHELMRPGMHKGDMDDVVAAFKKVYDHRKELES
ncbi:DegT/DnrJ/EryC1/StrS aminotransferase [bacterium CG10_46_32]|nr:MAG: DegT/DnrJ/EryC1/StrS aminotransferase [bacterium CG10_46_32]PIR56376.1 MAG: DegT/DnrJ/EryC1/StrS family aminotransferase [Parcubacteria group bacterium CG10_big_fil_rev_8_21_14_0_10_46_32]